MNETKTIMPKEEYFPINLKAKHMVDDLFPFRKKWSIIVLMEFKDERVATFQNLQQKFLISPSVLSSTLKELTSERIISRKVYGQISPLKIDYKITYYGEKIILALSHLIELVHENKKSD